MEEQKPEFDAFEGLDEVLGTNFVANEAIVESVPELVPDTENHPLSVDKLYLVNQLKKLDHDLEEVGALLKAELKIGAKPVYHNTYTQLIKAKLDIMKELRELSFAYEEARKSKKSGKAEVNVNASMKLTSNDLFALARSKKIDEAKTVDAEEVADDQADI